MNPSEAAAVLNVAAGREMMRAMLRAEIAQHSVASVARSLNVPLTTFRHFMGGAEPAPRLWTAALGLAFLREKPDLDPVELALNLIADTFPNRERVRVRRLLAAAIRPIMDAEHGA